jgi:hypothetical protein
VWRACNPVVLTLSALGAWRWRRDPRLWAVLLSCAGVFAVSVGPVVLPGDALDAPRMANPLYLAVHAVVPGFWRMAKPEVFFEVVWLAAIVGAGAALRGLTGTLRMLCILAILAVWWPLVRLHSAYPGLSAPQESALDPRWQQRVFDAPTTPRQ